LSRRDFKRLALIIREGRKKNWGSAQILRNLLHAMEAPTEDQYLDLCRAEVVWKDQTSEGVWRAYIKSLQDEKGD
jgi:hypothetical protein